MHPDPTERAPESKLQARVRSVAGATLAREKCVTTIGVLVGIGWLPYSAVKDWHIGRSPSLIERMQVSRERLLHGIALLHAWAKSEGLPAREGQFIARTPGREPLRFTATADPELERIFKTEWLAKDLSEAAAARVVKKRDAVDDLVVIEKGSGWSCHKCGTTERRFLMMQNAGPACLDCVGLGGLVFLPAGDTGRTRRAKKASKRFAVVVKFSSARKRYERQGVLVEPSAAGDLADEQDE